MTIKSIITIWNTLSNLKPGKTTESKIYALNVKKTLRKDYNEYIDFEKDAYEALKAEGSGNDTNALTEIILPEQLREVDVTLPELKDDVLFSIMEANPDVPLGAYDELIFNS